MSRQFERELARIDLGARCGCGASVGSPPSTPAIIRSIKPPRANGTVELSILALLSTIIFHNASSSGSAAQRLRSSAAGPKLPYLSS